MSFLIGNMSTFEELLPFRELATGTRQPTRRRKSLITDGFYGNKLWLLV